MQDLKAGGLHKTFKHPTTPPVSVLDTIMQEIRCYCWHNSSCRTNQSFSYQYCY